jgi:hypothetical protein
VGGGRRGVGMIVFLETVASDVQLLVINITGREGSKDGCIVFTTGVAAAAG